MDHRATRRVGLFRVLEKVTDGLHGAALRAIVPSARIPCLTASLDAPTVFVSKDAAEWVGEILGGLPSVLEKIMGRAGCQILQGRPGFVPAGFPSDFVSATPPSKIELGGTELRQRTHTAANA
jgi:hypothetical protein